MRRQEWLLVNDLMLAISAFVPPEINSSQIRTWYCGTVSLNGCHEVDFYHMQSNMGV
jgi:hypothetical protein